MIATIRATLPYKVQTLTTLQYAARARNVQNFSLVNVDAAGHSQLTRVSGEIERLKRRLQQRAVELDRLCAEGDGDEDEEEEDAKQEPEQRQRRLEEMGRATARERRELEEKLSQVILSPEAKAKTQREEGARIDYAALEGRLQRELARYEDTCARQQEEIAGLRGAVEVGVCFCFYLCVQGGRLMFHTPFTTTPTHRSCSTRPWRQPPSRKRRQQQPRPRQRRRKQPKPSGPRCSAPWTAGGSRPAPRRGS
jgi:hypothetical protein